MPANTTQQEEIQKTIDGLKKELDGTPEADSAARDEIQKKTNCDESCDCRAASARRPSSPTTEYRRRGNI
jgi:hypothetical protein